MAELRFVGSKQVAVTFLPIVGRELAVAARRPGTFRVRTSVAVLTSIIAAVPLLFGAANAGQFGAGFFKTLSVLAFLFCLLEGTRTAADSVSEEKREGTLGLLFLTDLRGYDVILGKLMVVSVRSFQGLLAFFPVLSVSLILGGVTAGEFWRTAAVLTNTLFVALALAIWISTLSRESHRALSATFICLLCLISGPFLLRGLPGLWAAGGWSISPASAWLLTPDLVYRGNPPRFWTALLSSHLAGWACLAASIAVVPRIWQDKPDRRPGSGAATVRLRRGRFGSAGPRAGVRAALLDTNPVLWLAARREGERRLVWWFVSAVAVIGLMIGMAQAAVGAGEASATLAQIVVGVMVLGLKLWVASQASSTLAEARRNGTVELLLGTPLKIDDVMRGQWLALKRIFFWPALSIVGMKVAVYGIAFLFADDRQPVWAVWVQTLGGSVFDILTFVVDLIALAWLGMWMGLSARKPGMAFSKTVLLGVMLPVVLFCVPNVLIDLVLISWARTKLQFEFRRVVSEQTGGEHLVTALSRRTAPPPLPAVPAR